MPDALFRRLTVINQFLEQVLDESLRLSDILLQTGFSLHDVESIRKHHLETFVDAVCDHLVAHLHEVLPQKRARTRNECQALEPWNVAGIQRSKVLKPGTAKP